MRSLEDAFAPLYVCSRIFGIPFQPDLEKSQLFSSWKALCFGAFVYLFNLFSCVAATVSALQTTAIITSPVKRWSILIVSIAATVSSVVIHTLLFAVSLVRWPALWKALRTVHSELFPRNGEDFYRDCRRACICSCLLIVTVSLLLTEEFE